MSHEHRRRLGLAILVAVALSGCAHKAARQTDVMEKTGAVSVSAAELRARINDLADRVTGSIEETADRIGEQAKDRDVHRAALVFKMEGIPAVYAAAYRSDPLEAAMDVWGLSFQLQQYLDEGIGRTAFGAQQDLARRCAQDFVAETDTVVRRITTTPEAFARVRERVVRWSRNHPIEYALSSRASVATAMADMRSEHDAFVAVSAVSDTLEQVSERLNTYAAQLPRMARWQAELLMIDSTGSRDLRGSLADVHDIGVAGQHVSAMLDDVPALMSAAGSPMREALASERQAMLTGISQQRRQTQEFVTGERLATLAAMRDERALVLDFVHAERVDTLKEVDAIKSRAVDASVVGLREVVDYALWRVALVTVFLMLVAMLLTVLGYRLTVGRAR